MKYQIDSKYLTDTFFKLVNTPSPVGYYVKLRGVVEALAAELGLSVTYDNKSTAYITLEGEDTRKTVAVGAHADTLGLMVRRIDGDGMLRVQRLGGVNYSSLEGCSVTVHTRDGREYTGLIACQSHSIHAFEDARTLERTEKTMIVILDERVKSADDVRALGIENGDHISIDPGCTLTGNGYLKSRFIDDKGGMACVFAALKYMKENGLKPKYNTVLAFPYGEEIGLGGTYVPAGVSEYVAVDIGLISPDFAGDEYSVSIVSKDAAVPYDYELTTRLTEYAKKAECDYAVDVYPNYSTDAAAALRAGNDLRAAAFGMAVWCSHGMERTHIKGLENTVGLLLAYLMDI